MDKISRYYVAILRGIGCASNPGYYYMVFYTTFFYVGMCSYSDIFEFSSFQEVLAKGQYTIGSVDQLEKEKEIELQNLQWNGTASSMPKST